MSSTNERLQEVPPEPMPEYTSLPEGGDRTIDDRDLVSSELSPTSMSASSSSDRPRMTDVLNSSPETPVSPKLDRMASATSSVKDLALPQSAAINTSELRTTDDETPPPPPPPRPLSPFSQAQKTLKEAFPNIDENVIKAVLIASGGQVQPAFNALLSMSDPGFKPDLPARPTGKKEQLSQSAQLEADEEYARRLAAELNGGSQHKSSRRQQARQQDDASSYERRSDQRYRRSQTSGYNGNDYYQDSGDKNWSFFDDDLPVIKENLVQGFNETRARVNEWVANFKKKLDGDDNPSTDYYASAGSGRAYSSTARPTSYNYRIGRQSSYDNDPTELDGNFSHLNLVDNTSDKPPPKPSRPLMNPELYKTRSPTDATSRQPILEDDEDLYTSSAPPLPSRSSMSTRSPTSPNRNSSKWEPLKAVEPTPDKDPFFIGDSDDEEKTEAKKQVRFANNSDDLK
ncbi:hypothetical protein V1517DRAFT_313624 [Lipomyces orientalis]|uniref:Uncharacterized protein n=1 Tax=Lipomyces orientalis TaxID=1233043 RepID=A0ACC3TXP8_9ASCO